MNASYHSAGQLMATSKMEIDHQLFCKYPHILFLTSASPARSSRAYVPVHSYIVPFHCVSWYTSPKYVSIAMAAKNLTFCHMKTPEFQGLRCFFCNKGYPPWQANDN
jgi:hypothetical protein